MGTELFDGHAGEEEDAKDALPALIDAFEAEIRDDL